MTLAILISLKTIETNIVTPNCSFNPFGIYSIEEGCSIIVDSALTQLCSPRQLIDCLPYSGVEKLRRRNTLCTEITINELLLTMIYRNLNCFNFVELQRKYNSVKLRRTFSATQ